MKQQWQQQQHEQQQQQHKQQNKYQHQQHYVILMTNTLLSDRIHKIPNTSLADKQINIAS